MVREPLPTATDETGRGIQEQVCVHFLKTRALHSPGNKKVHKVRDKSWTEALLIGYQPKQERPRRN